LHQQECKNNFGSNSSEARYSHKDISWQVYNCIMQKSSVSWMTYTHWYSASWDSIVGLGEWSEDQYCPNEAQVTNIFLNY